MRKGAFLKGMREICVKVVLSSKTSRERKKRERSRIERMGREGTLYPSQKGDVPSLVNHGST